MFQDYECPFLEKVGLLSECHISKEIYEIIEQIDSSHDQRFTKRVWIISGKWISKV